VNHTMVQAHMNMCVEVALHQIESPLTTAHQRSASIDIRPSLVILRVQEYQLAILV